jgi:mannose-1-phosphate guanylyltransferase
MIAHVPESPLQKGREIQGVGGNTQRRESREAFSEARLTRRWGVVLAGGEGVRLRGLTRLICGDDRPKQFCSLLGEGTLLRQTRQRAERSIYPGQILYSVTRTHRAHYVRDLADRPSQRVVQPCNRGTAPAILYTLLHISEIDPDAVVAILPCDHHYSPEWAFTAALESAFATAEARPESVVLLGARPHAPEVQYGWIELGDAVAGSPSGVHHVKGFREKPPFPVAADLFRTGSLWNTFVMVGHVRAFLALALESVPELMEVLRPVRLRRDAGREARVADWLYDRIAPTDFSRQVLSPGIARLVSMGLGDVEWNDLGDPERVISTVAKRDRELPAWARLWQSKKTPERTAVEVAASSAIA